MFAFFTGAKLYALIAVGVVILALSGAVAFLWQVHKADVAQAEVAKQNLESVSNALKQSEADKALLAQKARELDTAIQARDARLKALNETKRKLADELDRLKNSAAPEDKACLDRPLPPAILDLLRNGPADSDAQRHYPGPSVAPESVPKV